MRMRETTRRYSRARITPECYQCWDDVGANQPFLVVETSSRRSMPGTLPTNCCGSPDKPPAAPHQRRAASPLHWQGARFVGLDPFGDPAGQSRRSTPLRQRRNRRGATPDLPRFCEDPSGNCRQANSGGIPARWRPDVDRLASSDAVDRTEPASMTRMNGLADTAGLIAAALTLQRATFLECPTTV